MEKYINKWGIYPWFSETGMDKIHPEDTEKAIDLSPYGKVFKCIDEDVDYITLQYFDIVIRVKAELFQEVNTPKYGFNENVKVRGKEVSGNIIALNWHHAKGVVFYQLLVNGRKKGTRYYTEDFEVIT